MSAASQLFVQQLYQTILLRPADAAGLSDWSTSIDGGLPLNAVVTDFVTGAEAQQFVFPIVLLYEDILQRAPDPTGLTAFVNQLRNGTQTLDQIATAMLASTEFIAGSLTFQQFLTDIYFNMLGRNTDGSSLGFWSSVTGLSANHVMTAGDASKVVQVIDGIKGSTEYTLDLSGGNPNTPQLNWGAAVSGWLTQAGLVSGQNAQFSNAFGPGTSIYQGGVLSGLPGSAPVIQQGENIVLTKDGGSLVNGVPHVGPIITGSQANDSFSAVISQDANAQDGPTTLIPNDVINGNGGADILDVLLQSSSGSGDGVDYKDWATILNIPNIILISDGDNTNYWNANFAGVATYSDVNSDDSLDIYNIPTLATNFVLQDPGNGGIYFELDFLDSALSTTTHNNTLNLTLNGAGFGPIGVGLDMNAGFGLFFEDTVRQHLGINVVNLALFTDNLIEDLVAGDVAGHSTLRVLNISGSGNLWVEDQIVFDAATLGTINLSPYGVGDSRNSSGTVVLNLSPFVDVNADGGEGNGDENDSGHFNSLAAFVSNTSQVINFTAGAAGGNDTIILGSPQFVLGGIGFKQDTILNPNGANVTVAVIVMPGDQTLNLGVGGSFKTFQGTALEVHSLKGDFGSTATVNDQQVFVTDPANTALVLAGGNTTVRTLIVDGDSGLALGGIANNNITFSGFGPTLTTLELAPYATNDMTGFGRGDGGEFEGFAGGLFGRLTLNTNDVSNLTLEIDPSNNANASAIVSHLVLATTGVHGVHSLTINNDANLNATPFGGFPESIVAIDDLVAPALTSLTVATSSAPLFLVIDSLDTALATITVGPNVGLDQQVAVYFNPLVTTALHANGAGGFFEFFGSVNGYSGALNITNAAAVMLNPIGNVSTINAAGTGDAMIDFAGNLAGGGQATGVNLTIDPTTALGFGDTGVGIGTGPTYGVGGVPFNANITLSSAGTLVVDLNNSEGVTLIGLPADGHFEAISPGNVNVALTTTNATALIINTEGLPSFFFDSTGAAVQDAPATFGGATVDLAGANGVTSVTIIDIDAQDPQAAGQFTGHDLSDAGGPMGTGQLLVLGESLQIGFPNDGEDPTLIPNAVASSINFVDASAFGASIAVNVQNASSAAHVIGGQGGYNWVIAAANQPTQIDIPNFTETTFVNTDSHGAVVGPAGVVTLNATVINDFFGGERDFDAGDGRAVAMVTNWNWLISGDAVFNNTGVGFGGTAFPNVEINDANDFTDSTFLNYINPLTTLTVAGGGFNSVFAIWDDPSNRALAGVNFQTYDATAYQGTSSLIIGENSFNHTYKAGGGVGQYGPNTIYAFFDSDFDNIGTYAPTVQGFQDVVIDVAGEPNDGSPPIDSVNLATATGMKLIEVTNSPEGVAQSAGPGVFLGVVLTLPTANAVTVQLGDNGLLDPVTPVGGEHDGFPNDFDTSFDSSSVGLSTNDTVGNFVLLVLAPGATAQKVNLADTNFDGQNAAPATLHLSAPITTLTLNLPNEDSQQLLLSGSETIGGQTLQGAPATNIVVTGGVAGFEKGSSFSSGQVLDLMAANALDVNDEAANTFIPLHPTTTFLNASGLAGTPAQVMAAVNPNAPSLNTYYGSVWLSAANAPSAFTFVSGLGGGDWFIGSGTGFGGGPGFDDVVLIQNYQDAGFNNGGEGGEFNGSGIPGTGTTVWGGPKGVELTLDVVQAANVSIDHHDMLLDINNITVNMGVNSALEYFDPTDLSGADLQTFTVKGGSAGSLFAVYDYGNGSNENPGLNSNIAQHDPQDFPALFITGQFGFGGANFRSFDAHTFLGSTIVTTAPDSWVAGETMLGGLGGSSVFIAFADNNGGGVYGTTNAAQFGNWQTVVFDSVDLSPLTSSNVVNLPTLAAGLHTVVLMGAVPITMPQFNAAWTLQLGDGAGAFELPGAVGVPEYPGTAIFSPNQLDNPFAPFFSFANQVNITLSPGTGTTANVLLSNTVYDLFDGDLEDPFAVSSPVTLNIVNATTLNLLVTEAAFPNVFTDNGTHTDRLEVDQSILLTGTPAAVINVAGGDNDPFAFLDLSWGLTSPLNPATGKIEAANPPAGFFAGDPVPFAGPYAGSIAADFANFAGPGGITVDAGLGPDNQFIGSNTGVDVFNIPNFQPYNGFFGIDGGTYIQAGALGAIDNLTVPFDSFVVVTDNGGEGGPGLIGEKTINFTIGAESVLKFGSDNQTSDANGIEGAQDLNDSHLQTVTVVGGDNAEDSAFLVTGVASGFSTSGSIIDGGGVTNGAFGGAAFTSFDASGFKGFVSAILYNNSTIAGRSYIGSATPTYLFETLDWVGSGVYGGTLSKSGTWSNSTVFKNITALVIDNFEVAGGNDAFGPNLFDATGFNNVATLALTGSAIQAGLIGNANPALNGHAPISITHLPGTTTLQLGWNGVGDLGMTDQVFEDAIVANVTLTAPGALNVVLEDTIGNDLSGNGDVPPGMEASTALAIHNSNSFGGGLSPNGQAHDGFLHPGTLNPTNATTVNLTINNGNNQSILLQGSETTVNVNGDLPGVFLPNDGIFTPFFAHVLNLTGLPGFFLPTSLTFHGFANDGLPSSAAISGNVNTFTAFLIGTPFAQMTSGAAWNSATGFTGPTAANSYDGDIAVSFANAKSAVNFVGGFGDGNIVFGSGFSSDPSKPATSGGFVDNFVIPNFDVNTFIFSGPSGSNLFLYVLPGNEDVINNLTKGKVEIDNNNLTNEKTETFFIGNDVTLVFDDGSGDLGGNGGGPVGAPFAAWSHLTTITVKGGDAPNGLQAGSYFIADDGAVVGDVPIPAAGDSGLFAKFDGGGFQGVTQIQAADNSLLNSRVLSVITNPDIPGNHTVVTPAQTYIGGAGNLPDPIPTVFGGVQVNPNGLTARNEFVINFTESDANASHSDPNVAANNPVLQNWNDVLFLAADARTGVVGLPMSDFISGYPFTGTTVNAINFTSDGLPQTLLNMNGIGDFIIDGGGYFTLQNADAPIVLGGEVTFSDPEEFGDTFSGNATVNLSGTYETANSTTINNTTGGVMTVFLVDSFGGENAGLTNQTPPNNVAGLSPSLSNDGTAILVNFIVPAVVNLDDSAFPGSYPNFGGVSDNSGEQGYQDLNLGGLKLDPSTQIANPNHPLNDATQGMVGLQAITVSGGPPTSSGLDGNPSNLNESDGVGNTFVGPIASHVVVDFTGSNEVGNPVLFRADEQANVLDVLPQLLTSVDASNFNGVIGVDAYYAATGVNIIGGKGVGNSIIGSAFNDNITDPNFTPLSYIDGDPHLIANKISEIANLTVQAPETFGPGSENIFGVTLINFTFTQGLPDPNKPNQLVPVSLVDLASGNLNAPPPADLREITLSGGSEKSFFIWTDAAGSAPTTVNFFSAQKAFNGGSPVPLANPFQGNVQIQLAGGEATGGGLSKSGNEFDGGLGLNNVLVLQATNLGDTHFYSGSVSFFQQLDFVTYDNGNIIADGVNIGSNQRFMGLNASGFASTGAGIVGAINVANGTDGNPNPGTIHFANVAIISLIDTSNGTIGTGTPTHIGIGDKLVYDNITEPPPSPPGQPEGVDPTSPPNPSGQEFNEPFQFWPSPGSMSDAFFGGQYLLVNLNATGGTFQPLSLTVDLNDEGYFENVGSTTFVTAGHGAGTAAASAHATPFSLDAGLNPVTGGAGIHFFHGGAAAGSLTVDNVNEHNTLLGQPGLTPFNTPNGSAAVTFLTNGVRNFTFNVATNDANLINKAGVSPSTLVLDFDLAFAYDTLVSAGVGVGSFTFTGGQTGGVVALDHFHDGLDNLEAGIPNNITTIDAHTLVSDLIMAPDARIGTPTALTFTGYNLVTPGVVGGWDTVENANSGDKLTANAGTFTKNWLIANHDASVGNHGLPAPGDLVTNQDPSDVYDLGSNINETISYDGTAPVGGGFTLNFGNLDLSFLTNIANTGASGTTAQVNGTSTKGDTIIVSHYNDAINFTDDSAHTGKNIVAFDGNVYQEFTYAANKNATNLSFNSNSGTAYTHVINFEVIRDAAIGPNPEARDQLALTAFYSTQGQTVEPGGSLTPFGIAGDKAAKVEALLSNAANTATINLTATYSDVGSINPGGPLADIANNNAGKTDVFQLASTVHIVNNQADQPSSVAQIDNVATIEQYLATWNVNTGGVTARFIVIIADDLQDAGASNNAVGVYEVTANETGGAFGTNAVDAVKILGIANIVDQTHHFSPANWSAPISSQPVLG